MAAVAAFFAAISVGALGYAVVWAFDFSELTQPAAQAPREVRQETTRPAPRRKALVVVAPRVSGEDTRTVTTSAPHAAPPGETVAAAPIRGTDEASSLIVEGPPPTPPTPGEDTRAVATSAPHAAPLGETVAAMPMRGTDEASPLIVERPPPTPPTPGEDAPPIASSSRVSAASPAISRPMADDTQARSELVPQNEAKASPIQAPLPDPEPTGTIGRPTVFPTKPRLTQQPVRRPPEDALTPPGVTIIRGVPPVPGDSPAIVRPGPLIIHVPQPARR